MERKQEKYNAAVIEILKNNKIFLAPLAGVTDVGFRTLCKSFGAGLTCTEMISGKGLLYKNKKTEELLITDDSEKPCAVQLFGCEPDVIAEAVKNPLLEKFDVIDINMGCPVDKVVKCGEGSALMKNIPLAEKVIKAAVNNTHKSVTVKFRTGWDEDNIVAAEFAKMCEAAGASLITVHGRTRKQMYQGKADYGLIAEAVRAVKIPVIANGDIFCCEDMRKILDETGAFGVMIGRGVLGRPYVFDILRGGHSAVDIKELIFRHIDRLSKDYSDSFIAVNMRKHVAWYLKGITGGKVIKERVNSAKSTAEIKSILNSYNELFINY